VRRRRAKTTLGEGRVMEGSFRRSRGGRRKLKGSTRRRWKIGSSDAPEDAPPEEGEGGWAAGSDLARILRVGFSTGRAVSWLSYV